MSSNKKHSNPRPSPADSSSPAWADEWVRLDSIIKHAPFQVRHKLDAGTVKRYADRMATGGTPPPIKVARVGQALYLLDGWHRMEAGALQTVEELDGREVLALVADMPETAARWEAARANLDHGLPLRNSEYREVFRAFIKARKHKLPGGRLMSYRDMTPFIGKGHTTLRDWTKKDFPTLYRVMGNDGHGNQQADLSPAAVPTIAEEHCATALEAATQTLKALPLMDAEHRHQVAELLRGVLAEAERLGLKQPEEEPF